MTDDQSRLVPRASAVEALTQIRALVPLTRVAGFGRQDEILDAIRAVLDAVPVDATRAQGIDRDAAEDLLNDVWADCSTIRFTIDEWVDRVHALVRPVEGVTLTPEEARLLVSTLRRTDEWHAVHLAALASRLEALS